jgi:hypothetical protein
LLFSILCFASAGWSQSQTFNSGSNGSDGALNLTTPGTIIFDPKSFNPPLDPAGDNVYNFTTINIATGVTVKMSSNNLNSPIYWLAQGAVTINGTLDLSGENGAPVSSVTSIRVPAAGGPGGYSGGIGGNLGASSLPPTLGNGPGGGQVGNGSNGVGGAGSFTGSQYLIPLIGGSGGGGGAYGNTTNFGGGGSGGGGAILIASSVSITYGGLILAKGGTPGSGGPFGTLNNGGAGSGGAIRLIAPVISSAASGDGNGSCIGNGFVNVAGANGNNGIIRIEAFDLTKVNGGCFAPAPILSTPLKVSLPANPPSIISVTNINGIAINANPFSFPDAVINSSGPVTVNVQAQYIPLGVVPTIIVTSELGSTQTVSCSALQGTFQQSTCSASVTFLTGGSRGFVKATWTQ